MSPLRTDRPALRVAVVVDRLQDPQASLVRGIESVLHPLGVAVLVCVSHPLHPRRGGMLRRLVGGGELHGVVVTALAETAGGEDRTAEVLGQVAGVPVVTAGLTVPGVPGVRCDQRDALEVLLTHLERDCGRRDPVVLARQRRSWPDVDAEVCADRESAYRRLRDRLAAGHSPDAVVAGDSSLALGAVDALTEHGLRVPEDVSVVCLGNTEEGYRHDPSLTSFDEQMHAQGQVAARLLLAQLDGAADPEHQELRGRLVVRSSSRPDAPLAVAPAAPVAAPLPDEPSHHTTERLAVALPALADPRAGDVGERLADVRRRWLPHVLDGTLSPDRVEQLGAELAALVQAHPEPGWWRGVTAALHADVAANAASAQAAGDDARTRRRAAALQVTLLIERALHQVREGLDREELAVARRLLDLTRGLAGCRCPDQLRVVLLRYLPGLNVRRFFLAVVDEGTQARTTLAYRDGVELDLGEAYDPVALLPAELAGELAAGTLALQPLFSAERWLGFVLMEQSVPDRHTAEAVRLDVSRVLDAIARAEELSTRAAQLEALVEQRTVELQAEISRRRGAQEGLREANEELRAAVRRDGLTGLANRVALDAFLAQEWQRTVHPPRQLSVLMVDVDHFKAYNDAYGHLAGDEALRTVAGCLSASVKRNRDLVARYGGEEFAIVLPETGPAEAVVVAERLLAEVRRAAVLHGGAGAGPFLTVSVGVATSDGHAGVHALVAAADRALYQAKSTRDAVCVG